MEVKHTNKNNKISFSYFVIEAEKSLDDFRWSNKELITKASRQLFG